MWLAVALWLSAWCVAPAILTVVLATRARRRREELTARLRVGQLGEG